MTNWTDKAENIKDEWLMTVRNPLGLSVRIALALKSAYEEGTAHAEELRREIEELKEENSELRVRATKKLFLDCEELEAERNRLKQTLEKVREVLEECFLDNGVFTIDRSKATARIVEALALLNDAGKEIV